MPVLDYDYVVTIDQNATSNPVKVPTNQWQRKSTGTWLDVSGKTGITYTIGVEDRGCQIRLCQNLEGALAYSNVLQVTSEEPPALGSGYIALHLTTALQLRIWYDSPSAPVKLYYKQNLDDEWKLKETGSAGDHKKFTRDVPGYYAFDSKTVTACSFVNSHPHVEFTFDVTSDFTNCRALNNFVRDCKRFNQDLSWMSIPKVTNLEYAFSNANDMTGSVNFATPALTTMQNCFEELNPATTKQWNMDLSNWDTSKVTHFSYAFRGRTYFNNASIVNWDTSSALYMNSMFWDTTNFNQDLTGWCVENITSEPDNGLGGFSNGSALTDSNKPNWGAPC